MPRVMGAHHVVFAGGGTGGHLYPGIATADAVRARDPNTRITFLTSDRVLDRQLLQPTTFAQIPQPVRPLTLNPLHMPRFWLAWRESVRAAHSFLARQRPQAVLGLGGFAAGPAVVAARRLGIRTAILNPDVVPGRANRYLARYADLIVLQWEASRRHFSQRAACRTFGCPIRPAFANTDANSGRRHFELDPDRPVLLVTGASQGARSVNQTMVEVWPRLYHQHPDWQLLHLAGPADETTVRDSYAASGVPAKVMVFTAEMHHALAAADLVISRAGASTLAELTAVGRPAVLLPYPYHRDRHQHANAQVLVDAGAARLVEDRKSADLNAGPLLQTLTDLQTPEHRERMACAARGLGRPRAAETLAEWLLDG